MNWRAILDEPEGGRALRAFCRLATRSGHVFQRYSLARLAETATSALEAADWDLAAACMVQIAALLEPDEECASKPDSDPVEHTPVVDAELRRVAAIQGLALAIMHDKQLGVDDALDDDARRVLIAELVSAGLYAPAAYHLGVLARRGQLEVIASPGEP